MGFLGGFFKKTKRKYKEYKTQHKAKRMLRKYEKEDVRRRLFQKKMKRKYK